MGEYPFNLVIGLAGPYGAGCTTAANDLERIFTDMPGIRARTVKISRSIIDCYPFVCKKPLDYQEDIPPHERRRLLQQAGTEMRKKDLHIFAKLAIAEIYVSGSEDEDKPTSSNLNLQVFIIDSLKNEGEVEFLRHTYGDEFFLVYVSAYKKTRWERERHYDNWQQQSAFDTCDAIDSDEAEQDRSVGKAGQQVRRLAWQADYLIVNEANTDSLRHAVRRFVELLLGINNQPTQDEHAMHLAFSASNRSFCLSRQVGAALFDSSGNLIALGHNDPPRPGGSLYSSSDGEGDRRCYVVGDHRCRNDTMKGQFFDNLENLLKKTCVLTKDQIRSAICNAGIHLGDDYALDSCGSILAQELLKQAFPVIRSSSAFKDVTEYCRAVHAEMEALLAACRAGCRSTLNSTVYVTTEPCHNCAKHLIAAGVKRIVYIEPYPKSLALSLHSDALLPGAEPSQKQVSFEPYAGSAPRRYHDFFAVPEKRKDNDGRYIDPFLAKQVATPRFSCKISRRSRVADKLDRISTKELTIRSEIASLLESGNKP